MSVVNIDPNKPTREEVIAHNMKVAKANLASELAGKLCESGRDLTPKEISTMSIAIAEDIIEAYSLMPDAAGNKGGLVS